MTAAEMRLEVRKLVETAEQADDPRLGVRLVRARMRELEDAGTSVPRELITAERRFVAECIEASQGR